MGFAVDTDRGLFVPVVRDVGSKSIRQIAAEGSALVEQVRNGTVRPDDLGGGTFTITNLGMYEIDAFTPIINLPQCAILEFACIVAKQVVVDAEAERVAIRQMMFLSLTFSSPAGRWRAWACVLPAAGQAVRRTALSVVGQLIHKWSSS